MKQFVLWWTDERQIENGEFGGGLSDDGDMTNYWPGPALMGIEPEKLTDAVLREMEAYYENNMFDGGLNRIVTDELHVYEEGVNVIPQTMLLDYGDPKVVERLMKTASEYDRITGINDLGERMIRSTFYGGSKIYQESVWAKSKTHYSHLILQPGLVLVEFNGHPAAKKLLLEIADGLLAHRKKDANGHFYLPREILFPSGEDTGGRALGSTGHLFWAAWRWTGERKYLLPIMDEINRRNYGILNALNANLIDLLGEREKCGQDIVSRVTPQSGSDYLRHIAWQVTGNKQFLEEYYADQIKTASQRMYMYTDGHWWSDRVNINSKELQRSRLGGVALTRSALYPGHAVSWKFETPANDESVAILIPDATTKQMTIIAFNLENTPVNAIMTAWDIVPGKWEVIEGIDANNDDIPDEISGKRTVSLERTGNLELSFPARKTSVVKLRLKSKAKSYWERPDLGIGKDDVSIRGNSVKIIVHSLGSVDTPASSAALFDNTGEIIATVAIPALNAPLDYQPKTAEVTLNAPSGTMLSGCSVTIDPDAKMTEITKRNNSVVLP